MTPTNFSARFFPSLLAILVADIIRSRDAGQQPGLAIQGEPGPAGPPGPAGLNGRDGLNADLVGLESSSRWGLGAGPFNFPASGFPATFINANQSLLLGRVYALPVRVPQSGELVKVSVARLLNGSVELALTRAGPDGYPSESVWVGTATVQVYDLIVNLSSSVQVTAGEMLYLIVKPTSETIGCDRAYACDSWGPQGVMTLPYGAVLRVQPNETSVATADFSAVSCVPDGSWPLLPMIMLTYNSISK